MIRNDITVLEVILRYLTDLYEDYNKTNITPSYSIGNMSSKRYGPIFKVDNIIKVDSEYNPFEKDIVIIYNLQFIITEEGIEYSEVNIYLTIDNKRFYKFTKEELEELSGILKDENELSIVSRFITEIYNSVPVSKSEIKLIS